jgi:hypothetical protein
MPWVAEKRRERKPLEHLRRSAAGDDTQRKGKARGNPSSLAVIIILAARPNHPSLEMPPAFRLSGIYLTKSGSGSDRPNSSAAVLGWMQ